MHTLTAPMLGSRSAFSKSNPMRVFPAWLTPLANTRAAERIDLDHLVAEVLGSAPAPEFFGAYAEIAYTDDDVDDTDEWTPESMLDASEAETDLPGAPVFGTFFDPDDCQWGFTVRTRF